MLEVEVALAFLHLPVRQYRGGIVLRYRIGKGFLIRIKFGLLYRIKQRPQADIGRLWLAAQHSAGIFRLRYRSACQQRRAE